MDFKNHFMTDAEGIAAAIAAVRGGRLEWRQMKR